MTQPTAEAETAALARRVIHEVRIALAQGIYSDEGLMQIAVKAIRAGEQRAALTDDDIRKRFHALHAGDVNALRLRIKFFTDLFDFPADKKESGTPYRVSAGKGASLDPKTP